jgi:hypothetical protein
MPAAESGYQPRNTPAERRAFFDVQRQLAEILASVAANTAAIAVLEARVDDLETP